MTMTCNDTHDTFDCDYKYLLSASCDLILQVLLPCTKLYLKLLTIQNDKNDLKSSWQMMPAALFSVRLFTVFFRSKSISPEGVLHQNKVPNRSDKFFPRWVFIIQSTLRIEDCVRISRARAVSRSWNWQTEALWASLFLVSGSDGNCKITWFTS